MIIALNNKCNLTKPEFITYQKELTHLSTTATLILCPSSLYLGEITPSSIKLGAQNVSSTECGAYTGEISASQLKSASVKYCIVGHSERRANQHETDDEIAKKIKLLLKEEIIPILCVGEDKTKRQENLQLQVIMEELKMAMKNLSMEEQKKVIIAYEPIWSIGTGIIPTNNQIEEVINEIKKLYPENQGLYGGSANEENIDELKKISCIDGYLIGGLSLKPEKLKIFLEKLEN